MSSIFLPRKSIFHARDALLSAHLPICRFSSSFFLYGRAVFNYISWKIIITRTTTLIKYIDLLLKLRSTELRRNFRNRYIFFLEHLSEEWYICFLSFIFIGWDRNFTGKFFKLFMYDFYQFPGEFQKNSTRKSWFLDTFWILNQFICSTLLKMRK